MGERIVPVAGSMPVMSRVKGWTIVIHRWLGVGLCLLFLMWFSSAIGIA
jgi:hypothetical protein